MDISNVKHRYNATTSVGTSSEPRNQVPPPGPPPLQSFIKGNITKEMEILGDEHKWFYQQGKRDAYSSIWQCGKSLL